MIQNVQIIELVSTTNAWILAPCMIHVAKMQNVRQEVIGQCVDAQMDGQEIPTLNVTHVGFD